MLPVQRDTLTIHATGPMGLSRQLFISTKGATVEQLVDQVLDAWGYRDSTVYAEVLLDGQALEPRFWPLTHPKPKASICINLYPSGEGGGGAKIALGILSLALLPFTGGWSTAALLLTSATMVGSGIYSLAAGTSMPFTGSIPTANESFQLEPPRNAVRTNKPVRRVLGKMRIWPDFARLPYTEIVGDDQFLRLLFCVGYGPLHITEPKIGETDLNDFEVAVEDYIVHEGYDDDDTRNPIKIVNRDVFEQRNLSQALDEINDQRVIATGNDAREVSLDLVFPGGLITFNAPTGSPENTWVELKFEYDTGTGYQDAFFKTPLHPSMEDRGNGVIRFTGRLQGRFTRGVAFETNGTTPVDIRVTRVDERQQSPENTIIDQIVWDVLRTLQDTQPINVPNLCLVELRLKATDQLNGIVQDFNVVAEAMYPDYAPSGNLWQDSRLYAERPVELGGNGRLVMAPRFDLAFAEILRGPGNELPVPDARIDRTTLETWQATMDAAGRELNGQIDAFRTVYDVLSDISGSGRAALQLIDGRYGVIENNRKSLIADHISHRNSFNFSVSKSFRRKVHAIRVQYIDPDVGWQPNTVIVYNDDFDASNATVFDEIDLWGITQADEAFREGRFRIAERELRPRIIEATIYLRSLRVIRGDLVRGTFTTLGVGFGSGRLTQVFTDQPGKLVFAGVGDEFIKYGTQALAVRIQCKDGESIVGQINLASVPSQFFQFTVSQSWSGVGPAVGDLFQYGELASESGEFIVAEIDHEDGMQARLSLVDHAPGIFDADENPIPPFDPQLTKPEPITARPPAQPLIADVITDESALQVLADGTLVPRVLLAWEYVPNDVVANGFEIQIREAEGPGTWAQAAIVQPSERVAYIGNVDEGESYDIRIRSFIDTGAASRFDQASSVVVVGQATNPPPVINLRGTGINTVAWDYPNPPIDHLGFAFRVSQNLDAEWETASTTDPAYVTELFLNILEIEPPLQQFLLLVAAIDQRGNVSTAEKIILQAGIVLPPNELYSQDHHAQGYPDTKTNCTVDGVSGNLEADPDPANLFWGSPTDSFWNSDLGADFWTGGFLAWEYLTAWETGLAAMQDGVFAVRFDGQWPTGADVQVRTADLGSSATTPTNVSDWFPLGGFVKIEQPVDWQIRIFGPASVVRMIMTQFVEVIAKDDTVIFLDDYQIDSASGAVRIPVSALGVDFRKITTVSATITDPTYGGGNDAVSIVVYDKGVPNDGNNILTDGPLIAAQAVQGGNVRNTDAQADFTIRGYL